MPNARSRNPEEARAGLSAWQFRVAGRQASDEEGVQAEIRHIARVSELDNDVLVGLIASDSVLVDDQESVAGKPPGIRREQYRIMGVELLRADVRRQFRVEAGSAEIARRDGRIDGRRHRKMTAGQSYVGAVCIEIDDVVVGATCRITDGVIVEDVFATFDDECVGASI